MRRFTRPLSPSLTHPTPRRPSYTKTAIIHHSYYNQQGGHHTPRRPSYTTATTSVYLHHSYHIRQGYERAHVTQRGTTSDILPPFPIQNSHMIVKMVQCGKVTKGHTSVTSRTAATPIIMARRNRQNTGSMHREKSDALGSASVRLLSIVSPHHPSSVYAAGCSCRHHPAHGRQRQFQY